jgi:hypothetical protein
LLAVTKMIADMICGPAFIVMASGIIARLIILALLFLRRLPWTEAHG